MISNLNEYQKKADNFIENEKQFHLGFLTTESPHSKTANFSNIIKYNTQKGIKNLISVDLDIVNMLDRLSNKDLELLDKLLNSSVETICKGGRVIFSGCGATGRLSIILENMWRELFSEKMPSLNPNKIELCKKIANQSYSIMTGGDRALIKSVENFEDYTILGRRQVIDASIKDIDLLIALTEGGETSSVIGTALESASRGAKVFFIYNNPTDILIKNIDRSKTIIENSKIVSISICTGAMALTGSTRLQATSAQMLLVGMILELSLNKICEVYALKLPHKPLIDIAEYRLYFERLLVSLDNNTTPMAKWANIESSIYKQNGLVTYLSDRFLVDILSDTTERTPTFNIPPFKSEKEDNKTHNSWSFVKHPYLDTYKTWQHILKREPRGINWQKEDYTEMNVIQGIIDNPPHLTEDEIYSYRIGSEQAIDRYNDKKSSLIYICSSSDAVSGSESWLNKYKNNFGRFDVVYISNEPFRAKLSKTSEALSIVCDYPYTPLSLFEHLSVKIIFNTVSTATMGLLGKIEGNWMIDVSATNKKLIDRSIRIISNLSNTSYKQAAYEFFKTLEKRKYLSQAKYSKSVAIETLDRIKSSL